MLILRALRRKANDHAFLSSKGWVYGSREVLYRGDRWLTINSIILSVDAYGASSSTHKTKAVKASTATHDENNERC